MSERQTPETRETMRDLRTLGRMGPDRARSEAAVQRAVERLRAEQQRERGGRRSILQRRGLIMAGSVAASIAAMMTAIAIWMAGPSEAIAAPGWADVVERAVGVRAVQVEQYVYEADALTRRADYYVRPPATLRVHQYEVEDGDWVQAEASTATPTAGVQWDPQTGLAQHIGPDDPKVSQAGNMAQRALALIGLRHAQDQPDADIQVNGEDVHFEPVGFEHPKDASLRGFTLRLRNGEPALPERFGSLVYWFDANANVLRRLTRDLVAGDEGARAEGEDQQWFDSTVTLNPDLPRDWFAVRIPEGYTDVEAGVRPRLSNEVREVYDKAAAARKRFDSYRAVIWRNGIDDWPFYREARLGGRWRADRIDWSVMHQAMHDGNEPGYVRLAPDDPFKKLWREVTRDDYELERSATRRGNGFALIHYDLAGRGPRVSASLYATLINFGHDDSWGPTLHQIAWPEWMWTENLHPHGWDIRFPPLQYRLLEPDPEHPELVEVVGERDRKFWGYVRYTFDRSRDYLCVRKEIRQTGDRARIWKITDFGQTPGGRWYPTEVGLYLPKVTDGEVGELTDPTFVYQYAVDRQGAAAESFFDWPEGVPQPEGAFKGLRDIQGSSPVPQEDLPETAKGKYTTFGSRGLPRGFDEKSVMDRFSEMTSRMRDIEPALERYAYDHDWVFPKDLATLVEAGYLEPKDLLTFPTNGGRVTAAA